MSASRTTPLARRDAVVVGGGISGLATAFWLEQAGCRVTLLEAAPRVGGALSTWAHGPWLFEEGPNTVLDREAAVDELLESAGLAPRRRPTGTAGRRRYLYLGGRLVALPAAPPGLVTTPLLPWRAKLRVLREPLIRRGPAGGEESVAQLVRRRLGPAVLERAVAPWIAGTWAGDPERLSAPWALPRLAALERDHRSLLVGALVTALRSRGNQERRRRGGLTGFAGGFGSLAEALAERLADVRTGCPATAVGTAAGGGLVIETAAGALTAPRVVLAVPADRAAALLSAATGGASDLLAEIPYAPLAVVSLGYRRDAVRHPLDGFGFLAVPGQGLSILGCIFPASLFPDRAPEGHAAFTAFLGGRTDPAAVELPDRELLEWVIADLSRALGLAGEPVVARVHRWRRAIPQYEIGHGRFVARAAELEARLPGLRFAVNWLDGTAVPDCVARARRVAYELAGGCSDLAVPPPR